MGLNSGQLSLESTLFLPVPYAPLKDSQMTESCLCFLSSFRFPLFQHAPQYTAIDCLLAILSPFSNAGRCPGAPSGRSDFMSVALDILWLGYFATLQSFIQFTENILCAWHYARDDNNTKK